MVFPDDLTLLEQLLLAKSLINTKYGFRRLTIRKTKWFLTIIIRLKELQQQRGLFYGKNKI